MHRAYYTVQLKQVLRMNLKFDLFEQLLSNETQTLLRMNGEFASTYLVFTMARIKL